MGDFDADPGFAFSHREGVWRDGPTLVMTRQAVLPFRCVKCNAPARYLVKRLLTWYHPAYLLLLAFFILPGFLLFMAVVAFVQREATVPIPVCPKHHAQRRRGIMIAWICFLAGFLICFTSRTGERFSGMLAMGVALMVFGAIFGVIRSRIVTARKIDGTHLWIDLVCPAYLERLPVLPDPRASLKPKGFDPEL